MQLFELFNSFLNKDLATSHRHLDIKACQVLSVLFYAYK